MKSYIATAKSPCRSHPDWLGLECPNINKDKNIEPCASCDLPSKYDDSICKGPKRFADDRSYTKTNPLKLDETIVEHGFETIGEFINAMHDDYGMGYSEIAEMIDKSRSTVKRAAKDGTKKNGYS
jgi:hypothetical protein